MSGAGDFNADGLADFAVSHYVYDAGGDAYGAVDVHCGSTGRRLRRFVGRFADDGFGRSLAGVGDLTGDGLDDLLVSAPHAPNANGTLGESYLLAGRADWVDGPVISAWDAALTFADVAAVNGTFGLVLAPAFDLTQDGLRDLVIVSQAFDANDQPFYEVQVHDGATGALIASLPVGDLLLAGDHDQDHDVDGSDSDTTQANYGQNVGDNPLAGDADGDGDVDLDDVWLTLQQQGMVDELADLVAQPLVDTEGNETVNPGPGGPGEEIDPYDPCADPNGDCDGDGIPNKNDPDSGLYDPSIGARLGHGLLGSPAPRRGPVCDARVGRLRPVRLDTAAGMVAASPGRRVVLPLLGASRAGRAAAGILQQLR